MNIRIDIDRYSADISYQAGYDDGCDDGFRAAMMDYKEEIRQLRHELARYKRLRDELRAMLEHGEAPERETSR